MKFDFRVDFLGRGGYGEVFKATWDGYPVAVKRFGRKCIIKKSIIDYVKEVQIVSQMRHPNIITFYGVSFDEHQHYYMITDFAERGSVFDMLHS